jgi:hypothetical protein
MLPIELWHIILNYSIAAPDLFDPDYLVDQFPPWVIKTRHWFLHDEHANADSTLNTLRKVCRSWSEYLRRHRHRWVRMADVAHGKVPLQYLKSAIRVSFGSHSVTCCSACKLELLWPDGSVTRYFEEFCSRIFEREQPLRAKILDCGPAGFQGAKRINFSHTFPDLVHINGDDKSTLPTKLTQTIEPLLSLRHMYLQFTWSVDRIFPLNSSTLTSLSLSFKCPSSSYTFTAESLHLPALKHLDIENIYCDTPGLYDEPIWLRLVRVLGKELWTLALPFEAQCRTRSASREIWDICPKLEDLFISRPIPDAPPVGHPIHTLGVPGYSITRRKPLTEYIPDWPGLHTVRINMRWEDWRGDHYGPLTDAQMEWLGSRICLQDRIGEPYSEYLSRVK